MAQVTSCSHCQKTIQVPDNAPGKKVPCPPCNHSSTLLLHPDRHGRSCGPALPTSHARLMPGAFRSAPQLAGGGFGAVCLATATKRVTRPVAVKDMRCADPQEFNIRLNFFRREAEILRL